MKILSDFHGEQGIVVAASVLGYIMDILTNAENLAMKDEKNPIVMFTTFMKNSPKQMQKIFAVLSEKDPDDYQCDGQEAMVNMLTLANDPLLIGLFTSQSRKGDATSSGSVSGNTEE